MHQFTKDSYKHKSSNISGKDCGACGCCSIDVKEAMNFANQGSCSLRIDRAFTSRHAHGCFRAIVEIDSLWPLSIKRRELYGGCYSTNQKDIHISGLDLPKQPHFP